MAITLDQIQAEKKTLWNEAERQEKWDARFLKLAEEYATWSKDPRTRVGCVIVADDKTVIASGYNGPCRGVRDDVPARLQRPEKLLWFEHAERNSIYNAAKRGIALSGSTAYSTLCPCMDRARALVQSGIKRIVCPKPDLEKYSTWADQFTTAEILYQEAGVILHYV